MLVATYALLTLRIEQTRARASIRQLQDSLAQRPNCEAADGALLAALSEELIAFAESHHQRRLDDCLLPALRVASAEAGESLRNLEHLCQIGLAILPRIRAALRPGACAGAQELSGVNVLVEAYCQNLLQRLACEEDVLLPLAERVLPSEAWFNVGTEFLAQDAERG
ncbi:MAG: hemerythrin domain-containing protein [Pseudomonadota bacterium]